MWKGIGRPAYLDREADGLIVVAFVGGLWLIVSLADPHELGLQDVAAVAILAEKAVVEVHLHSCRLEVQSDWGKPDKAKVKDFWGRSP